MASVTVKTKDGDPNTKLQELRGYKDGNPVIAILEKPARIKLNNGTKLTVDGGSISAADGREYYHITEGKYKGKYVKKEDAQ
jgi:hypothetical protein